MTDFRFEVQSSIEGFGDAALGTTLVAIGLVVLCLLAVYLNSTQVQIGSRNIHVVALDLLGVRPTRSLIALYSSTV